MNYYRIDEYIAQGDRVVALGQVSFKHKKTGKPRNAEGRLS